MSRTVVLLLVLVSASSTTIALLSAQALSSEDDWAMFQHDPARTGYSASTFDTSAVKTWNASTNYPLWSSPAVAGGYVYIKSASERGCEGS